MIGREIARRRPLGSNFCSIVVVIFRSGIKFSTAVLTVRAKTSASGNAFAISANVFSDPESESTHSCATASLRGHEAITLVSFLRLSWVETGHSFVQPATCWVPWQLPGRRLYHRRSSRTLSINVHVVDLHYHACDSRKTLLQARAAVCSVVLPTNAFAGVISINDLPKNLIDGRSWSIEIGDVSFATKWQLLDNNQPISDIGLLSKTSVSARRASTLRRSGSGLRKEPLVRAPDAVF